MGKKIIFWGIWFLIWMLGCVSWHRFVVKTMPRETDTTKVTVIDTIPYYKPEAKDSVVVRYERVKLPTSDDKPYYASLSLTKPVDSVGRVTDSVTVELPITQKWYGDSTYTAWVSGYNPTLDSIYVYPRHETVTITNTLRQKPRRWGLGVSAGYGVTAHGAQPYIGIGVQYNIVSFGKRR